MSLGCLEPGDAWDDFLDSAMFGLDLSGLELPGWLVLRACPADWRPGRRQHIPSTTTAGWPAPLMGRGLAGWYGLVAQLVRAHA